MTDVLEQLRLANPVRYPQGYTDDEVRDRVHTIVTAGEQHALRAALAAAAAVVAIGAATVWAASAGRESAGPGHATEGPAPAFESTVQCVADRKNLTAAQEDRVWEVAENRWLDSGINRVTTSGNGYAAVNVPDDERGTAIQACVAADVSIRSVVVSAAATAPGGARLGAAPTTSAAYAALSPERRAAVRAALARTDCAHPTADVVCGYADGTTRVYLLGSSVVPATAIDVAANEASRTTGRFVVRIRFSTAAAQTLRAQDPPAQLVLDDQVLGPVVPDAGGDVVLSGYDAATAQQTADDIWSGAVQLRFDA